MNDLDIMKHAKTYIDKMANGIDPLTDEYLPPEDLVNNVRISRCLFYVSDVLRQVIENGGVVGKKPKEPKKPFVITAEQLANYEYSEEALPVTHIAERINALVDPEVSGKLKYGSITAFLMDCGLLYITENLNGYKMKAPTEQGMQAGIFTEERQGIRGPYIVTLYKAEAQKFIIDNMDAITEINNSKAPANGGNDGSDNKNQL